MRGAIALAGLAACGTPELENADGPPSRELAVERVEDLGRFPEPSARVIGRDGGPGGMLGGKLLWTFGDSFTDAANPVDGSNVLSATAGWSTVDAPLALVQPVDAGGFPAQFIPYTAEELAQNQADPLDGWGLWPGMMVDTGAGEGLVFFQRIKRTDGAGFDSMGVGAARVTVDATVATRVPGDIFSAPDLYMPVAVHDGAVYVMACGEVGFLNVGCTMGRAPVAQAAERAAYTFSDGVVIDGLGGTPSLSWNPYLGKWIAVSGRILSSTLQLRTASVPEGPWSAPVELEASADGSTGIFAPLDPEAYNYVYLEHPELRSADGRGLVISYSRPTEPFRGDVRLVRVTLR